MPRSWPSPFEIAQPDLQPLHQALAKCGVAPEQISQIAKQLSRPPLSFGQTATDHPVTFPGMKNQLETAPKTEVLELKPREFDPDIAARMLHFNEGNLKPEAKWTKISRAERKRAKRLWDWTGQARGLGPTQQGRPPVIDSALVLYCACILCDASGRRPSRDLEGRPGGPTWRALIEALPLAQSFLAGRFGTPAITRHHIEHHAETIFAILAVVRSKYFKLVPSSDSVAASPAMFRLAIAHARKSRLQSHRK
jgi:hypothetical protein